MKIESKSMYQHAKDGILTYIEQRKEHLDKLPAEQEFANMMGVSRNTVREAIRILEREGVLYSRHGVGTFLVHAKQPLSSRISVLESATKIIESHGYRPGTIELYSRTQEAGTRIGEFLGIEPQEEIFYIERVRTADDRPVVYVEDYILCDSGTQKAYVENAPESLLEFLEAQTDKTVGQAICGIKSVISNKKIEEKLRLKTPSALLLLEQTHFSVRGQPMFYSDSFFLSDQFEFNIVRQRT